jgi:hypothetical protein
VLLNDGAERADAVLVFVCLRFPPLKLANITFEMGLAVALSSSNFLTL